MHHHTLFKHCFAALFWALLLVNGSKGGWSTPLAPPILFTAVYAKAFGEQVLLWFHPSLQSLLFELRFLVRPHLPVYHFCPHTGTHIAAPKSSSSLIRLAPSTRPLLWHPCVRPSTSEWHSSLLWVHRKTVWVEPCTWTWSCTCTWSAIHMDLEGELIYTYQTSRVSIQESN